MKLSLRTIAVVSFLVSLLTAGLSANPSLAEEAGLDFWNVPAYHEELRLAEREFREADRKDSVVFQRTVLKIAMAHDVADGKLSFEEATARFAELNRMYPPAMDFTGGSSAAMSEETAAHQVAAHVRATGKPGAAQLADDWECTMSVQSH